MAELPAPFQSSALGAEPVSRATLSEHQRERVLERVTALFAKRGYQGASVDDLLAAGKVGVTNFYSLFAGKEDCFLAAFDRVVSNARAQIAAADRDRSWSERTYIGLRAVIEAMLAEPLAARLVLVEAQSAGPTALARYNGLLDAGIEWLRAGRSQSPAARGLPAGFEQASIFGLAFYLQQCLLDSRRHRVSELFDEAAKLVLEPMIGAGELRSLRNAA